MTGPFNAIKNILISEPIYENVLAYPVFRWRTMLYIASVPGFVLAFGMQFAVDSPRWLCKARLSLLL